MANHADLCSRAWTPSARGRSSRSAPTRATSPACCSTGPAGWRSVGDRPLPAAGAGELAREHAELELVRETSLEALPRDPYARRHVIDGDHNYWTVSQELELIAASAEGADLPLLIFHDVCWPHARRDDYFAPELIPDDYRQPYGEGGGLFPGDRGLREGALPYRGPAAREGGPRNGVLTAVEDFVEVREGMQLAVVPVFYGLGVVWHVDAPWASAVAETLEPFDRNPMLERLETNRVAHLATSMLQVELAKARARLQRQRMLLQRMLDSSAFSVAERLSRLRLKPGIGRPVGDLEGRGPPRARTLIAARLGPPDHANRGNRAQVLDQHLVHGELGQADPLAQLVRQVASSAGLRVASVPEEIDRSFGGEMRPDDLQRLLGLQPERCDVEGEDLVELLVPEVDMLDPGRLQRRPAFRDMLAIPARGHLDHLLRAIDRGDPSAGQPLADQRYGHAVSAADLQHAIGWVERQGVHRPHEPFRGLRLCHAYVHTAASARNSSRSSLGGIPQSPRTMDGPTDRPDWRLHGVRVVHADELDPNTPQTPGMSRAAAITAARAGAEKLWAGTVSIHPDAKTGAHHHGPLESVIYVVSGQARMRWGERLEFMAEAGPGDFIYVPPFVPHQEINASPDAPLSCVVVRSGQDPVVVNLDLPAVEPDPEAGPLGRRHPPSTGVLARGGWAPSGRAACGGCAPRHASWAASASVETAPHLYLG